MRVLVDVVEHQAGGANPSLAKDLARMTFKDETTNNESTNGIPYMYSKLLLIDLPTFVCVLSSYIVHVAVNNINKMWLS